MWPVERDNGAAIGASYGSRDWSGATQTTSEFAAILHHLKDGLTCRVTVADPGRVTLIDIAPVCRT